MDLDCLALFLDYIVMCIISPIGNNELIWDNVHRDETWLGSHYHSCLILTVT